MLIVKKTRKVYPLLNVLRLMRVAKPLIGVRGAFEFYTAPIKWLVNLGRLKYEELLPTHLLLSTKYGLYYTPVSNIHLLFEEVTRLRI